MQNLQRILIVIIAFCVTLTTNQVMAERPALEMIPYEMPVGVSELVVPALDIYHIFPTDIDVSNIENSLVVRRRDIVSYDDTSGIYTYTFWKSDGTQMDLQHEMENRVLVSVQCQAAYDGETREYVYAYAFTVFPDSPQALGAVVIDTNSECSARTNLSSTWDCSSTQDLNVTDSPPRIFLNSIGSSALPGEDLTFELRSPYGPIVVPMYAKGVAQRFPRPAHLGKEAFARHPATVEGVRGKTIAPGELQPDDSEALLHAALEDGLRWGWIDESSAHTVQETLTNAATFSDALSQLKSIRTTLTLEPEFQAILDHVLALHSQ